MRGDGTPAWDAATGGALRERPVTGAPRLNAERSAKQARPGSRARDARPVRAKGTTGDVRGRHACGGRDGSERRTEGGPSLGVMDRDAIKHEDLTLREYNYVKPILEALETLPFEVIVKELDVCEEIAAFPEVQLRLVIRSKR